MTDITVIILIGQEKIHLKRCIEKLAPLEPRQIFLVESQPDDGGVAIAKETAAQFGLRLETMYNKWPGNQAAQFNWALDELEVKSKGEEGKSEESQPSSWILRLDADEYLTEQTSDNLKQMLCGAPGGRALPEDVNGLTFELKRKFMGGEIRHATNGIRQVRMFRRGKGRYPDALMDERILVDGKVEDFDGAFYDDNLNGLGWWQEKHRGYAKREAKQALTLFDCSDWSNVRMKNGVPLDPRKVTYYKLPRYVRAVMYFCGRYFLRGGFLDGKAGWRWNFWQGFWYRWIVDREIGRLIAGEAAGIPKVSLREYRNPQGDIVGRFLWEVVWMFGGRWTPRWALNGWRRLLMRAFGAKVGKGVRLQGGAEIWQPWRIRIGANSWIDGTANLYSVDDIRIGHDAVISEEAYICTASHDLASKTFALTSAPIEIGDYAWICARAVILPGVKVGEGAVVAAGSVVTKDVEPWTVVGGVPAKFIKKREIAG